MQHRSALSAELPESPEDSCSRSLRVIAISVIALLGYSEAKPSLLGIGTLAAVAVLMPLLATQKRRLSARTGSAALRADAAESAFCGYHSVIALLGLVVNTVWHIRWADPAAALPIVP